MTLLEGLRRRRVARQWAIARCEHGRWAGADNLDGGVWHVDDWSPCDAWARRIFESYGSR